MELTDDSGLSVMKAVGLEQNDAAELHSVIPQNPDIPQSAGAQFFRIRLILNKNRHVRRNGFSGTGIKMIELKMGLDHRIHLRNVLNRQRKITWRTPQIRIRIFRKRRNRTLLPQPGIPQETHSPVCEDCRLTSDFLKFHSSHLFPV